MANMNSLFAKPGPTTMPAQPTVKPAASTLTGTGTPWQRGTRGMDRVNMPGVKSYAPQRPIQSHQQGTPPPGYDQFKANMPPMGSGMGPTGGGQLPNLVDINAMMRGNRPPPTGQGGLFSAPQSQGSINSRLFAQPGGAAPTATGFGGAGVAPTGDTSTWTAGDWQRYNQFQQQQQNPLAAALSNYNTGG